MEIHIKKYYRTERISSLGLVFFGAFSASCGLVYYLIKGSEFSLGIMLGLCLLGSFQIIMGMIRIFRSIKRYRNSVEAMDSDLFLKNIEYPRIQQKEARYHKMRKLELSGIALGFGLLLFCFLSSNNQHLLGTAAGLTFQSGFMLAYDLFGQFRLQEYLHQLHKFIR